MELRYPDHERNAGSVKQFAVEICEDCIMRANGIFEEPEEIDDLYETCPEWDGWDFSFTYPESDPEGEGEPRHHFSKGDCDGCHTPLYGTRYSCIATNLGDLPW